MISRSRSLVALVVLVGSICSVVAIGASARVMPAAFPIALKSLFHDTRSSAYRSPFGAAPAGSSVTLRLRTGRQAGLAVTLVVQEADADGHMLGTQRLKMRAAAAPRGTSTELWQTSFTPRSIGMDGYAFRVQDRSAVAWYSSGAAQEGGVGQAYRGKRTPTFLFQMTVYDPQFHAPSWASDASIYQIFPDRFFNGDPSNDGKVMDPQYDNQHPVIHTNWSDAPLGGSDFFGGDLQGIIDKLPYLKGLGVNTLYLNPIFEAPSNHKYDTSDYYIIDPHFGTMKTLQDLLAGAHADGIRVLLDGVFNHTGSDSIYFNRYGHFPDTGAYQSQSSPYFSWYTFLSWPTSYISFSSGSSSFDTLPQLNENDAVKDFIFRKPDSVAQHRLGQGTDGWRLDALQLKSHTWWQQFRAAVKAKYPEDILIGEDTAGAINATPYLLGNEVDGVMNYRFRSAILRFFAHGNGADVNVPSTSTGFMNELMSIVEDYPLPALYSSMNLVDSHDTERILYDLGGNKTELKEVATVQMTWLGAPTIYYGDEAGLTGAGDPDDRRTFPWDNQDADLQAYYRKVIGIRAGNPALRDGRVSTLAEDNRNRVVAFLRQDARQRVAVVINDGGSARKVTLKIAGLPTGTTLTDQLTNKTYSVKAGAVTLVVNPHGASILAQAPTTP